MTTKEIKQNTRERALSTDFNRSQKFLNRALNDTLKAMLLTQYPTLGSSYYSGDDQFETATVSSRPVRAVVLKGLRPYPINGSVDLLITAGHLVQIDDAASVGVDDSQFANIISDGVSSTGILTLTPNSSGTGRVDIVECKVVDYVYETSSRDVFNIITKLFSPQNVDKVVGKKLEFRIRTGTPSSAWPGIVDEWLPLAVLVVPDGTTDFDTVDIYDVRPFLPTRARGTSETKVTSPIFHKRQFNTVYNNQKLVQPVIDAEFLSQRVIWGRTDNVATSPTTIDVTSTDYRASGYSPSASDFWHLYLAFPFGLPRWSKYSDSTTSPRKPVRDGIPIITSYDPTFYSTCTNVTITLPTATGLVGTVNGVNEMMHVLTGWVDSGGTIRGSQGNMHKDWISPESASQPQLNVSGYTDTEVNFDTRLIIPTNAKKARIRVTIAYTYTPGSDDEVPLGNEINNVSAIYPTTSTPIQDNLYIDQEYTFFKSGTGYTIKFWFTVELPGWYDMKVETIFHTATAVTPSLASARLIDWTV